MNVLSGGNAPADNSPQDESVRRRKCLLLADLVQIFFSTHYVKFTQAILYRGAVFDVVWRGLAAVAGIGLVFFTVALMRVRRTVVVS